MRTIQSKLAIAVFLCVALFAVWAIYFRDREPRYQGRSLSEWSVRYQTALNQEDAASRTQAEEARFAIKAIGANAIPILLKNLRYDASPLRRKLAQLVGQSAFYACGGDSIVAWLLPSSKCEPTYVFRALGEQGNPAVPELTRLLFSTTNQVNVHRISYCLAAIGDEAMPSLVAALSRPEAVYREEVVCWFASEKVFDFGTNIAQAAPALAKCSTDPDPLVSVFAVKALGRIKAHPEIVLPALEKALHHPHAKVRAAAASVLGQIGRRTVSTTQRLSALLTDEYEHVRSAATNSLLIIVPEVVTNAPPQ